MTKYIRLCKGLNDKGLLVPKEELYDHIKDTNKDYYRSVYHYSDDQRKRFDEKGTIAGITDVETNLVVFDFDCKDDLNKSRKDALDMVSRLIERGLQVGDFNVYFSGSKGFSIEIETTHRFSPNELKNLAYKLSEGLETADSVVYNPSRVFRIPMTKHPVSGLYKVPISLDDLSDLTIDQIKEYAKDTSNADNWEVHEITLPDSLIELTREAPEVSNTNEDLGELDLGQKPKWLSPCKYAILMGHFKSGNRSNALMALCAAIKSQGIPKEVAHRMLKGAAELQAQRTNTEPFNKEEIWNNIVSVVYGPNWNGATYGCKDHKFLQDICPSKNSTNCHVHKQSPIVTIDAVADKFTDYATNIDKNTVKIGIKCIDDKIRLQTCSHVVIAGSSGSGKTTTVLNILNNVSNAGSYGMFASLDMPSTLIYQKLAQRISGLNDKELYNLYKSKNQKKIEEIKQGISKEYKNIMFDFRSGVTVEELRENLLTVKNKVGNDLKLVVIDFINRIRGPYSEETANLAYVAPRLSDLANETETLIVSLAQTARHKGGPATPLTDSRISKGSSAIEESATVVMGIWRNFYMQGEKDKYISAGVVKTRMGREFVETLHFDGLTSRIRELTKDEQIQFEKYTDEMEEEKLKEKSGGWTKRNNDDSPW
jgi:KaiC/GvpD/RAD55 family RecA-like ATPase